VLFQTVPKVTKLRLDPHEGPLQVDLSSVIDVDSFAPQFDHVSVQVRLSLVPLISFRRGHRERVRVAKLLVYPVRARQSEESVGRAQHAVAQIISGSAGWSLRWREPNRILPLRFTPACAGTAPSAFS
jgi:hypothetical protein